MPCTCDGYDDHEYNEEARMAVKLGERILAYPFLKDLPEGNVLPRLAKVPKYVSSRVNTWCTKAQADKITDYLCQMCRHIEASGEALADKFIYNGRDADCRELAEWWDRHKVLDAKRRKAEEDFAKLSNIVQNVEGATVLGDSNNNMVLLIKIGNKQWNYTLDELFQMKKIMESIDES